MSRKDSATRPGDARKGERVMKDEYAEAYHHALQSVQRLKQEINELKAELVVAGQTKS